MSLKTVVTLALQNSPRVLRAQDDVNHAVASLAESKDAYVPILSIGGGVGRSYGITLTVPTIFTVNAQSLLFSYSQRDYIRAAHSAVEAASLTYNDVREQVEEDTVLTCFNLDEALERHATIVEQYAFATRIVAITRERVDVGLENELEYKRSHRRQVQSRLQQLESEHQIASLKEHLAQLIGLPAFTIEIDSDSMPHQITMPSTQPTTLLYQDTPALRSAEANARARMEQAYGDTRYTGRPQLNFFSQYGRISPINDVSAYYNLNGKYNTFQAGVALSIPLLDRAHSARARETMADALRAGHDAKVLRSVQVEDRLHAEENLLELSTRADLAEIDYEIAKDELHAMLLEVQTSSSSITGRQMNPKDELYARLQERQGYLDLLEATLQMRRASLSLLRQTGALEAWLRSLP